VEQTAALEIEPALEIEARAFGAVTAGAVCKNLLHVFFLRDAAKKRTLAGWFPAVATATKPASIARVGVVGAGVMGSGIAHWLAAHGCEVVLRDVQNELVERGLGVIRGLFGDAVQRGKLSAHDADVGLGRIATTTGWEGFASCDLVIEAIVENAAAKQKLFSQLAEVTGPDTLLASNTSALPIEEIAGHVPNPARTLGLHFFNPVSRMSLVELIIGRHTSAVTAERALTLVKSLGKMPVICRSSPGFLVTRVLFFYLNEAVRLWEDGVAATVIDAALREVGWPMGPMRLIDEVGVDVTDFIFGELAHYFPDRFVHSTACTRLLSAGFKGRKNGTGSGFFRYGARTEQVNDEVTRALAGSSREHSLPPDEIADHMMRVMISEARRCLDEGVVQSPDDVDFALLSGAGFPTFHGGLMRYARRKNFRSQEPGVRSKEKKPEQFGTADRRTPFDPPSDGSLHTPDS
jgi:3-hydroxyacyl-CoA dehydrogenase/enoyl-CoA hydratase/3-hydroxybutyryl-CoA epimerase